MEGASTAALARVQKEGSPISARGPPYPMVHVITPFFVVFLCLLHSLLKCGRFTTPCQFLACGTAMRPHVCLITDVPTAPPGCGGVSCLPGDVSGATHSSAPAAGTDGSSETACSALRVSSWALVPPRRVFTAVPLSASLMLASHTGPHAGQG